MKRENGAVQSKKKRKEKCLDVKGVWLELEKGLTNLLRAIAKILDLGGLSFMSWYSEQLKSIYCNRSTACISLSTLYKTLDVFEPRMTPREQQVPWREP